jgi:SAM-dependent methyltransferase
MSQRVKTLQKEYDLRFSHTENYRAKVWKVLCSDYFSRYIRPEHAVLDMGSGWGEFINNIHAASKFAMDLNPDAKSRLNGDIHFLQQDCSQPWDVPENSMDIVFSSNFLEHLPDKAHIEQSIHQAHRCLREGGRVIFLGPNIKYVKGAYWDFWDHFVPLTEQSLAEILRIKGFQIQVNLPRFLPYSMSTGMTPPLFLLKLYLHVPFFWKFFGKQFLVVARKVS